MSGAALATSRMRRRDLVAALAALLLGLLGWGLLFHAEIAAAIRVWTGSTAYNHGFVVLPIALWLAWDRRATAAGQAPRPTAWPALAALPLGLAWFAADRLGIMEGRQLAALGLLETLLVAWLGWRLARAFAAPLAYLVFLVPFGAELVPSLQVFTARFIDIGLDVIGIPHVVTAFTIEIPEGRFYVAEACAGLRFLIAAMAFGALYALMMYRGPWRRLAFFAVACAVPIVANGLRALGIVVLGHILGSAEAAAADHLIYGWGFFSAVILLLTVAGLPFRQDTIRRVAPAAARNAAAWPAALPAVAATMVLAVAAPALAALLDRGAGTAAPVVLPRFAAAGCRATGGTAAAQTFDCNGATLTARVLALSPRSGPAPLRAALQAAADTRGAEDVRRSVLTVDGIAPQSWQLAERLDPPRATASAIFLDGRPSAGGLAMRLHLARTSTFGGGGRPVLVAVTLMPPAGSARAAATQLLHDFLAAQGAVLQAAAAASAAPATNSAE
ncbi:MAG: exosortase [Rhodospirillales bacterium]|nr:exosortase [Rhodospirillales bacterium]